MKYLKKFEDACMAVYNRNPAFALSFVVFVLYAWCEFCRVFIHGK